MSEDLPDGRVTVSIADHVAVVTLTRPDKHNALDLPMFDAIIGAGERLRTESGVRAVVLHGAGKSFSSGLDFPAVAAAGGLEAFTGILDEAPPITSSGRVLCGSTCPCR